MSGFEGFKNATLKMFKSLVARDDAHAARIGALRLIAARLIEQRAQQTSDPPRALEEMEKLLLQDVADTNLGPDDATALSIRREMADFIRGILADLREAFRQHYGRP